MLEEPTPMSTPPECIGLAVVPAMSPLDDAVGLRNTSTLWVPIAAALP
jgi:hypothetical protein